MSTVRSFLVVIVVLTSAGCTTRPHTLPQSPERGARAVSLPLAFERNDGQAPGDSRFLVRLGGQDVRFGPRGVNVGRVVLRFDGAAERTPIGEGVLEGRINYLIGPDPSRWRRDIPTFNRVRYPELYRDIDAVFYAADGSLEYDLVVRPGADVSGIALSWEGADAVAVNAAGDLVIRAAGQEIVQHKPVAYQETAHTRIAVDAAYRVSGNRAAIEVGDYDRDAELVIDPVIAYSMRFGGTLQDFVRGLAVDANGNLYVAGETQSADFPTTAGAYRTTLTAFDTDLFVSKISPSGKTLIYSTYVGGSSLDRAAGIAVDADGNAYVTGQTISTNFPTTPGAFQERCAPSPFSTTECNTNDGFVFKLNSTGSALAYSTYLGGTLHTFPGSIAVNSAREAVVVGETDSADFPITPGAAQQHYRGGSDGFVTKIAADGGRLGYSTFLGGARVDRAFSVVLDGASNAYVTGGTTSTDFPVMAALQPVLSGPGDAFVTKFTNAGALVSSSYFGGPGDDGAGSIALSENGVFIGGATRSNFMPGATSSLSVRETAAFVSQLSADLTRVIATRVFDGSSTDNVYAVVADATAIVHVFGLTESQDFPVTSSAMQPAMTGSAPNFETFYATLPINSSGVMQSASFATYLGGRFSDFSTAMTGDRKGGVYIGGYSDRPSFPMVNARWTGRSGIEGFIAHIVPANAFTSSDARDLVLYTADATAVHGNYRLVADPTAAAARRMSNPDAGAAKITTPSASPADYFEMKFDAPAGVSFRFWMRGLAQNNSTSNDSVWVQFSDSVDVSGKSVWRIGTTSGVAVGLEECSGCGVSGWGWHDDGWGVGNRGPTVRFATSGSHTVRVQVREDGLSIDQLILSSFKWLTAAPGATKNTTTVRPKTLMPSP
jgi:hypothetical protein